MESNMNRRYISYYTSWSIYIKKSANQVLEVPLLNVNKITKVICWVR